MFVDALPHRCSIYRLYGVTGYDFTLSDDGEVDEDWRLVASDVKSRFDPKDTPFQRRADAVVESGNRMVFVGKTADVRNADRIYRASGDTGAEYYEVIEVKYIRDFNNKLHHKELVCSHIDWTPPVYTAAWVAIS